jgi:type I restriction enzyme S subunit
MLDSILPTPVKLTHSEILFSAAATLAFQVIEKGGRPIIRLSRLCEKPQYGYTASAQAEGVGPRFLRITDIKAGSVDWKNVPYCDCPEPEKYLLKPGDILVARSGSVGKSFLVSECPEPTVFASYMIRMRAKPGVLAGYVYWYLQTQQFWFQIKESKRGSAMKNINSKMLSSARVPDATLSQQRAVVSFLTWFQNRINGDYKTPPPEVPELLDVPRIVARIEELTALIEEAQGLRVKAREEARALLDSALYEVFATAETEGWDYKLVKELCEKPQYGYTESAQLERVGPKFLRITDIQNGAVNWDSVPYCVCKDVDKYRLQPGDMLFARTGATTGKSFLAKECPEAVFASYLIRLQLKPGLEPEYLYWFFQSPQYWTQVYEEKKGSAQANMNARKLSNIVVPIAPSKEERNRIVAYLDGLQAQVDELTALQDATQAELDALLPSVLDQAFRGEL